jgi:hypothetical protein
MLMLMAALFTLLISLESLGELGKKRGEGKGKIFLTDSQTHRRCTTLEKLVRCFLLN